MEYGMGLSSEGEGILLGGRHYVQRGARVCSVFAVHLDYIRSHYIFITVLEDKYSIHPLLSQGRRPREVNKCLPELVGPDKTVQELAQSPRSVRIWNSSWSFRESPWS